MNYKVTEIHQEAPDHDCDFIINFPGGKQLVIQLRPSNAALDYNGSLDVILPYSMNIGCYKGDDLEEADVLGQPNHLFAKQIIAELPTY